MTSEEIEKALQTVKLLQLAAGYGIPLPGGVSFEDMTHARQVIVCLRNQSAVERVVDDVPSPVPKALLSCRPMWDRVEGSD